MPALILSEPKARGAHRYRAAALFALLLVALAPRESAAQRSGLRDVRSVRLAVYDSRMLFDSMPGRNAVESEFALEQAKARAMVAAASDSLRFALDELVRVEERLTPREREAGKLNLRARELLVEQMVENLDMVIQQRLDELRRPLLTRMHDAVRTVRLRLGYHMLLDRGIGDGLMIDADDGIDITGTILLELRKPPATAVPGASLKPVSSETRARQKQT